MKHLFKITLSGIRGRKRDTWLFASIIVLATLFVVSTAIFNTSVTTSKREEQQKRFGNWEVAALERPASDMDKILADPRILQKSLFTVLGNAPNLGLVGTLDENYTTMAHMRLDAGSLPKEDGEIAIEASLNKNLIVPYKVGDEILVNITIPIVGIADDSLFFRQNNAAISRIVKNAKLLRENPTAPQYRDFLVKNNIPPHKIPEVSQAQLEDILARVAGTPIERIDAVTEQYKDVAVVVNSSYLIIDTRIENLEIPLSQADYFAYLRTDGTFGKQVTVLSKKMKVSGIISSYSEDWDLGDARVPTSFVTPAMGDRFREAFKQSKLMVENQVFFNRSVLMRLSAEGETDTLKQIAGAEKFVSDFKAGKMKVPLIVNANGMESVSTEADRVMANSIIFMVLLFTLAASFQLNFIQLKKRARKMALMRAIGATYQQLSTMVLIEMVLVMAICLPLGALLGMGLVKGALTLLTGLWHFNVSFVIDWPWLMAYMSFTGLAVMLGMLVPLVMALRLPLTGSVSRPPKHKKRGPALGLTSDKPLTFLRLNLSHFFYEHKKNAVTAGLYTLSLSCLLLSAILSYWAFESYREAVVLPDKPSYVIEYKKGLPKRRLPEYNGLLHGIEGVSRAEIIKGGEFSFLWHKDLVNHPVLSAFKKTLTQNEDKEHFGTQYDFYKVKGAKRYILDEGVVVNPLGINPSGDLFKHLMANREVGRGAGQGQDFDLKAFEEGQLAILLLPQYKPLKNAQAIDQAYDTNAVFNLVPQLKKAPPTIHQRNRMAYKLKTARAYDLSYAPQNSRVYSSDYGIAVGDTIEIASPQLVHRRSIDINDVILKEVTVGAIVNDFTPLGLWPASSTLEGPVVLMSYGGLGKLYPKNIASSNMEQQAVLDALKPYQPSIEGRTWINVYTSTFANHPKIMVALKEFAEQTNGKIVNLQHLNGIHFARCLKIAAVLTILGVAIAIFALMILYNMTLSKVSSEQNRIGILQALGVTTFQFKQQYRITALGFALAATVAAHILLVGVIAMVTLARGISPIDYLLTGLFQYPWAVHGLMSATYFALAYFSYYLPIRRIVKNEACVNING